MLYVVFAACCALLGSTRNKNESHSSSSTNGSTEIEMNEMPLEFDHDGDIWLKITYSMYCQIEPV